MHRIIRGKYGQPGAAVRSRRLATTLARALIVVWVVMTPGVGQAEPAAGIVPRVQAGLENTLRHEVALRCAKLIRVQGQEYLANGCGRCVNVQIHRSRGGGGLPIVKTLRVETDNRLQLPYKGPGSTRISNIEDCPARTSEAAKNSRDVAAATAQCILVATLDEGYVLLNRCPACRQTVVRWRFAEGGQQNYPLTFEARQSVTVPKGAETGLAVVHEEACQG